MAVDAHHPNSHIQSKLESIYRLHHKKMDFRIDAGPYRELLEKLGNPQNKLPPTIHLAGTNGKGSTQAFIKSICESSGLKVHSYTSPHLIKFNERITLDGQHINDDTLLHYLDLIEITNAGAPITFFEYTTAIAFKAMADHPADVCLLETGLGGQLDCTNVIENPIATIITSIGHDHMDWLGSDIATIAFEKAGIMKHKVPCIVAPQKYDDKVRSVFITSAEKLNCDIHFVERMPNLPILGLIGDHQKDNASTALKALSITHPEFKNEAIETGLKKTAWPARMEKLSDVPEIWFDCGHNAEGALVIAEQLKQWKIDKPERHVHLIIGLASDKDAHKFVLPLWEYCSHITCVDLLNARNAQTGVDLMKRLNPNNFSINSCDTVFNAIKNHPAKHALTLVTGSLYLYEQQIV